jgi:hypothetical protein
LAVGAGHDQRYLFVRDIYDAVPLRNNSVRFFYYGQFNGHHMSEVQPFGFVCQARSKNGSALDKLSLYLMRLQTAITVWRI